MGEEPNVLLMEELVDQIKNLANLTPGSKEHSEAVESVTKLYKLTIEDSKAAAEYDKELEMIEKEEQARKDQLAEQKKDRCVRIGLASAELILPLMFYGIWMRKGFKFEESGSFTSMTFKDLIKHFRPTKK